MNKSTLSNGIRVVTEQIPTCRSVSFGVWVKAGSRYESSEMNGVSHFIEHMLFKGSRSYSTKEIAELFDGLGGNVNAFTAKEYTCYYFKVLDEHFQTAAGVLADMILHPLLDSEELNKERKVILEEIAMYEDTPDDLVHDLIAEASFGKHPLGQTILGTRESLDGQDAESLRSYMQRFYTTDQMVISMVGNINESMMECVDGLFSEYGPQGQACEFTEVPFLADQISISKKTEQNHICLSLPGYPLQDARVYAMLMLNNAIGGGMSSRLFQEIREDRGLAYSVFSYHTSYMKTGLFTIYAGTASQQSEEVLDITMQVLHDIQMNGLTDTEISKGKEQLKGSLIMSLESNTSRMNRMGKQELMLSKHESLDAIIERIDQVNKDSIDQVIQELFTRPFAAAMVGQEHEAITKLRRDQLVL